MKKLLAALGLALAVALAGAPAALARGLAEDQVVVGNNFTLSAGQTINGNLIVLGGNVTVEDGATITQNVVVFGGNVDLSGSVKGDLVIFGGNADLRSTAVVTGQLVTSGGSISRETGSQVLGGETQSPGPRFLDRPLVIAPQLPRPFDLLITFLWDSFRVVALAVVLGVLALLVALLLPDNTARVSAAIASAPVLSGGLGLLTLVAVPVLAGLLALITLLCLSPLSLIALIVYVVAALFGWLALGALIGERLAAALRWPGLSPILAAGLGAFLMTLVAHGIGLVPLLGGFFSFLVQIVLASIGLGAVTLTRFGTRPYLPSATGPATPNTAPPPPLPPEPPVELPPVDAPTQAS